MRVFREVASTLVFLLHTFYVPSTCGEEIFESQLYFVLGSKVKLQCPINRPGIKSWFHEEGIISVGDQITDKMSERFRLTAEHDLIIPQIQKSDTHFWCTESLTQRIYEFNVSIMFSPTILSWEQTVTGQEGKQLSVDCIANGNPKPKVYWSGQGVSEGWAKHSTEGTLSIAILKKSHHKEVFSCVALNAYGTIKRHFVLRVVFKPVVHLKVHITKGQNNTTEGHLQCEFESRPEPRVWWLVNKTLHLTITDNIFIRGSHNETLVIQNLLKMPGTYTVKAKNSQGESENSVTLDGSPEHVNIKVIHISPTSAKIQAEVYSYWPAPHSYSVIFREVSTSQTAWRQFKSMILIGKDKCKFGFVQKIPRVCENVELTSLRPGTWYHFSSYVTSPNGHRVYSNLEYIYPSEMNITIKTHIDGSDKNRIRKWKWHEMVLVIIGILGACGIIFAILLIFFCCKK